MERQFPGTDRTARDRRLRCVGFGVPSLNRALWCAGNALTLVAQSEIQPYDFVNNRAAFRHINLHNLPWPTDVLRGLGATEVTMRVTLSYFIEPSPGQRGWNYSHRYAGHGLRFDVKRPTESNAEFQKRLNRVARAEEEEVSIADDVAWTLGAKLRSRGSIHSDWWHGIASDLAGCSHIGVFPVTGWWRERPKFERWRRRVRYALIVSIAAPGVNVDLYTPIMAQIAIPTPVGIP